MKNAGLHCDPVPVPCIGHYVAFAQRDVTSKLRCRIAKRPVGPRMLATLRPQRAPPRSMTQAPRKMGRPKQTAGNNTADGYQKRQRRVVVAWVLILQSIPGRVTETGPNRSKETGLTPDKSGTTKLIDFPKKQRKRCFFFERVSQLYYVATTC